MDYETIIELPHAIGLNGVENDRDLGGYTNEQGETIRHRRLLRTGRLSSLTTEDAKKLQEEYQIGTIIDFRTPEEVRNNPDVLIPDVRYVHINLFPERITQNTKGTEVLHSQDEFEHAYQMIQNHVELDSFYVSIMKTDTALKGYRRFFDELLQLPDDKSLLFHCTAGKDRTGMAAAFLMAVLGFDTKTLMEDYVLTNKFCSEKIENMIVRLKQFDTDEETERSMRAMFGVLPEIMEALFAECEKQSGSIAAYVKEVIGITDEEIQILKEKYLLSEC